MKIIFLQLKRLLEFVQFVCAFLAVFYAVVWIYRAFQLPYGLEHPVLEAVPDLMRYVFKDPIVNFNGLFVDMSYLFGAIFIFIVNLCVIFLTHTTEDIYDELNSSEIREREKEEIALNMELEKEKNTLINKNTSFLALIEINLEFISQTENLARKIDLNLVKKKSYKYIMNKLGEHFVLKSWIIDDKLAIFCDNFDKFDDVAYNILNSIKALYKINKDESLATTSFYFTSDAMVRALNLEATLKTLNKISTLKYKNKIVITANFLARYDYVRNKQMESKTMGISRFINNKSYDSMGNLNITSEDFELYSMRFKDRSKN